LINIEQVDFEPPAQLPSVHLLTWAQLVKSLVCRYFYETVNPNQNINKEPGKKY
jgi:hypothetical protein